MKTLKQILFITVLTYVIPTMGYSQGQPYFSENWNNEGGEMAMFYKNAIATDDLSNVYITGSTINSSGNHDILI